MYLEAVLDFVKTHGFKLLRVIEKKICLVKYQEFDNKKA